jgi:hypothetical protein
MRRLRDAGLLATVALPLACAENHARMLLGVLGLAGAVARRRRSRR